MCVEVYYVIDLSMLRYDGPNDICVTLQVALYFFSHVPPQETNRLQTRDRQIDEEAKMRRS